jgi:hypothetical protein
MNTTKPLSPAIWSPKMPSPTAVQAEAPTVLTRSPFYRKGTSDFEKLATLRKTPAYNGLIITMAEAAGERWQDKAEALQRLTHDIALFEHLVAMKTVLTFFSGEMYSVGMSVSGLEWVTHEDRKAASLANQRALNARGNNHTPQGGWFYPQSRVEERVQPHSDMPDALKPARQRLLWTISHWSETAAKDVDERGLINHEQLTLVEVEQMLQKLQTQPVVVEIERLLLMQALPEGTPAPPKVRRHL